MKLGSQKYLKTACRLTKSLRAISRRSTRGQIICNSIWKKGRLRMKRWQMNRLTQLRLSVQMTSDRQLNSPTLIRDLDQTASMVKYLPRTNSWELKSCKRLLTHSTMPRFLSTCELVDSYHYKRPSQKDPVTQTKSGQLLLGHTCQKSWRKQFLKESSPHALTSYHLKWVQARLKALSICSASSWSNVPLQVS